ncbi:MAG TPA: integrase arm-type DNA-binding domain-containing protein [Casimicrobiaceae bacterium]|nr:integrase arm-type DNA-binding domain-containing protein [Casimicrobiaceae bacterium]
MQRFAGFRLAIARQGGRRTWITQYRVNGRQRRVTIGSADLLTVEQARVAARKILASVVLGDDPQGERRRKREVARVTLRSVVDDYLRSRAGRLRPRTEFEIRRYLTGPYFRPLHATPIEKIERQAVAAQIMRIERESGVATATAARSALSAMFVWGMKTGIVERNPLIGCYAPATPPSRDRVLSDSELVAIWRACGDDALGRITRLLILTGQRRSEIGGMSWGELDRELRSICCA